MKRFFVPLVVALACTSAAALAQVGPGGVGPGAGTQLGIQQLDQSGQVGFVTLFNAGAGMDYRVLPSQATSSAQSTPPATISLSAGGNF